MVSRRPTAFILLCLLVLGWFHASFAVLDDDESVDASDDDEDIIINNRVIVSNDCTYTRMANIIGPTPHHLSTPPHMDISTTKTLSSPSRTNPDMLIHDRKSHIQWSRFSIPTQNHGRAFGSIIHSTNPANHLAVLTPPDGCHSRSDITVTMKDSMLSSKPAEPEPVDASDEDGDGDAADTKGKPTAGAGAGASPASPSHHKPSVTERPTAASRAAPGLGDATAAGVHQGEALQPPAQKHSGHFGTCRVAINGGFFNSHTGSCLNGVVSNGYTVQYPTNRNIHLGVTSDGYFFFGYLNDNDDFIQRYPSDRWDKEGSKRNPLNDVGYVSHKGISEITTILPDNLKKTLSSSSSTSPSSVIPPHFMKTTDIHELQVSKDRTRRAKRKLQQALEHPSSSSSEPSSVRALRHKILHSTPTKKTIVHHELPVTSLRDQNWRFIHLLAGLVPLVRNGYNVCTPESCADGEDMSLQETGGGFITIKSARTAIGHTIDGRLIIVSIDGKSFTNQGANLYDMASIMHSLGAYNAMNLDGGGSAQLAIDGIMVNTPSDDGNNCPEGLDGFPGNGGDRERDRRHIQSYWHRYDNRKGEMSNVEDDSVDPHNKKVFSLLCSRPVTTIVCLYDVAEEKEADSLDNAGIGAGIMSNEDMIVEMKKLQVSLDRYKLLATVFVVCMVLSIVYACCGPYLRRAINQKNSIVSKRSPVASPAHGAGAGAGDHASVGLSGGRNSNNSRYSGVAAVSVIGTPDAGVVGDVSASYRSGLSVSGARWGGVGTNSGIVSSTSTFNTADDEQSGNIHVIEDISSRYTNISSIDAVSHPDPHRTNPYQRLLANSSSATTSAPRSPADDEANDAEKKLYRGVSNIFDKL